MDNKDLTSHTNVSLTRIVEDREGESEMWRYLTAQPLVLHQNDLRGHVMMMTTTATTATMMMMMMSFKAHFMNNINKDFF